MRKIDGLTGLRGYAALWVTVFHAVGFVPAIFWFPPINFSYVAFTGQTGVDIFFVLSGFFLALPFLQNPDKKIEFFHYMHRRCARIFPAYYFQITILFILSLIGYYSTALISNWIAHILMVHNFSSAWSGFINGVWWTLPIEFEFYIALPFIILAIKRFGSIKILTSLICIAISYKINIMHMNVGADIAYKSWLLNQLPGSMDLFSCGIGAAIIHMKLAKESKRSIISFYLMTIGIIGMVAMLHWLRNIPKESYWSGHYLLFLWGILHGSCVALLVIGIALVNRISRVLFSNRLCIFMGEISYGVYLWHMPVMLLIFKNPIISPYIEGSRSLTYMLIMLAICLIATVGIAAFSYFAIELPLIRKSIK